MSEPKKLAAKLAEVMAEVKYIQKRGKNAFHGYKYATEADVADKVREALSARNIILVPDVVSQETRQITTKKGNTEFIDTLKIRFTFYDGDSDQTISFHMIGSGQDAGDKAAYKAITGAEKYALMKTFLIPTGDDPEVARSTEGEDVEGVEPVPDPEGKRLLESAGSLDELADVWRSLTKEQRESCEKVKDQIKAKLTTPKAA